MTIWILSIYAVIVTIVCLAFHKLWQLTSNDCIVENSRLHMQLRSQAEDIRILQATLRVNCPPVEVEVNRPEKAKPTIDYEAMFVQVNAEKMAALRQVAHYKRLHEGQGFSGDEINSLINLCHPDKHGGKPSAHRMTQRLLELRK